jgi:8-oxo-dGTP diphosphatase
VGSTEVSRYVTDEVTRAYWKAYQSRMAAGGDYIACARAALEAVAGDIAAAVRREHARTGVAAVIRDGDRLLMILRSGKHGSGTWSVPGGWVDFGETWKATAEREVVEETGVIVKAGGLIGVTNDVFADDGVHSVCLWIECRWVGGEARVCEPEKCPQVQWRTLPELHSLPLFPPLARMLPVLTKRWEQP